MKGIDLQLIRDNYQGMNNEELIRIATNDAIGLTPEAQQIIKEEIEKRNLDANIIKSIYAQNKTYTVEEVDEYCDLLRNLDCPSCGTSLAKLNGTLTSEVMSFVVVTKYTRKLKVACPDCLDKANNNALFQSAALGWWGFPWGIIRTIQSINHNLKCKKTNHLDSPNNYLRSFVLFKVGQLEMHKTNKGKLQEIISA